MSSCREGPSFRAQGFRAGRPGKLVLSPPVLGCVHPGFEPQEGTAPSDHLRPEGWRERDPPWAQSEWEEGSLGRNARAPVFQALCLSQSYGRRLYFILPNWTATLL